MPKQKPTQVITHRIEFQEMERELLKQYMSPKIVQGYAYSAGAVVVCVGIGMAGYSAYWFLKKFIGWGQDAAALWDMTFGATPEIVESIKEGKTSTFGVGGPLTPLFRYVGGLIS